MYSCRCSTYVAHQVSAHSVSWSIGHVYSQYIDRHLVAGRRMCFGHNAHTLAHIIMCDSCRYLAHMQGALGCDTSHRATGLYVIFTRGARPHESRSFLPPPGSKFQVYNVTPYHMIPMPFSHPLRLKPHPPHTLVTCTAVPQCRTRLPRTSMPIPPT